MDSHPALSALALTQLQRHFSPYTPSETPMPARKPQPPPRNADNHEQSRRFIDAAQEIGGGRDAKRDGSGL
jgi:hypothetical protein